MWVYISGEARGFGERVHGVIARVDVVIARRCGSQVED